MIRKLLVAAFVIFAFNTAVAQNQDPLLQGFDEKAAREKALKAGVHDHEMDGYIELQKRLYKASKKAGGSIKLFSDTNGVCTNIGFEDSTFSGWTGYLGDNTVSLMPLSNPTYGFGTTGNRRHCIMSTGVDPYGLFPVVAPGGGKFSARLGNDSIGAYGEQLQQTFKVSADNVYFTYRYAVVLNDNSHIASQQPFLLITMLDNLGDTIPCSTYRVTAAAGIPGFQTSGTTANFAPVRFKTWTTITVDLTQFVGQYVTIVFLTGDCTQTGHFGYAYIDCQCGDQGQDYFCPGDSALTFCALDGYKKYEWYNDQTGALIDTVPCITINFPNLGDKYHVELTPITTNDTNCIIRVYKEIKLNPHPFIGDYLLGQNVMTPNNDNVNDVFSTRQFPYVKDFEIQIYNRWGVLVFKSTDTKDEWNGKMKNSGPPVAEGVYYWMAFYTSSCDAELLTDPNAKLTPIKSHGFVHVLR